MNKNREPKGLPVGGQFAADVHAEPVVELETESTCSPTVDSQAQAHEWIAGQASHHLSPVIGWIRKDAASGKDTSGHIQSFHDRVHRLADDVLKRFTTPQSLNERADASNVATEAIGQHLQPLFLELSTSADDNSRLTAIRWRTAAENTAQDIAKKVTAPAPILDGFTSAEVEEYMAKTEHERQCGCDLPNDVCMTPEYGENWRWRMGVPNVEGMFEALQEMATARES